MVNITPSGTKEVVGKTGTSFTSGRTTYAKRWSVRRYRSRNGVHNPSGKIVTPRVVFLNYPNQVTDLKDLLGRRLPLRESVQRWYVLSDPTGLDCISVRLVTGVTSTMVKFIIADK